jgi:hypothetical protein
MAAVLKFVRRPCEPVWSRVAVRVSLPPPVDEDRVRVQKCGSVAGAIAGGLGVRQTSAEDLGSQPSAASSVGPWHSA